MIRRQRENLTSSSRSISACRRAASTRTSSCRPLPGMKKNDRLNTSDMHPFIHPLSTAVDPVWESRSDWETYKTIAKRFFRTGRRPSRRRAWTLC